MAAAAAASTALPVSFPAAASFPRAARAPVSALRSSEVLPAFTGLRISSRRRTVSYSAVRSTEKVSRRRAVVCEAQETAVDVPDVTKATWQSLVMESPGPVLVEFWAPWCGPCRMILPTIAKLSKTYENKLKCFKLNTDESPDIASLYGIRSIPTIMIFKNGEKKDAIIGAVPESTLVTCIEKFVER